MSDTALPGSKPRRSFEPLNQNYFYIVLPGKPLLQVTIPMIGTVDYVEFNRANKLAVVVPKGFDLDPESWASVEAYWSPHQESGELSEQCQLIWHLFNVKLVETLEEYADGSKDVAMSFEAYELVR